MGRSSLRPVARAARAARAHVEGASAFLASRSAGGVRVSYGLPVPAPQDPAVGGIVKLQHLTAAFPDDPRHYNLLYLVTSRLPPAAVVRAGWARLKGASIVVNQNGVAYPAWRARGWQQMNAEMAALLKRADYVFYQSQFCRDSADRFVGPTHGGSEVLYNAVDTSRFVPALKPPSRRELTLLLAGSQDFWYRFESAICALAEIVRSGIDADLIVTGRLGWTDPKTACSEAYALIDRTGTTGRVDLAGAYVQTDAPRVFHRADIVLHTKYNDPCPTVVIEALACGRPVVYSKSGGVPELVGDAAGAGIETEQSWDRTIPPDPGALAEHVLRVRARLPEYQTAARARAVEKFDVRPWLERHKVVFERLVA